MRQEYAISNEEGTDRPCLFVVPIAGSLIVETENGLQLTHLRQELAIRLRFGQALDEQFHGFNWRKRV